MIDPQFYNQRSALALDELLAYLDMDVIGTRLGETLIQAPSQLRDSPPHTVTFLSDKRRAGDLDSAQASACFVTEKLASIVGEKRIIPLVCSAPRAHFARASRLLITSYEDDDAGNACGNMDDMAGLVHPTADIHSSAKVHKTAVIGPHVTVEENAVIAPYVVIERGVKIGAGSIIGAHSHISFCYMGKKCHVKSGVIIGGSGFGIASDEKGHVNIPHFGRVLIGDNVYIGSQSCIDRGQLGDTVLGDNVKIDNLVQIAHNVEVGEGTMMAGLVGVSGSCKIGKNCQLGGRVGLADHITLGDGAILTASSGVAQNVPAGEIWGGTPALPFREHMRIFVATRKLARRGPKAKPANTDLSTPSANALEQDKIGDAKRTS